MRIILVDYFCWGAIGAVWVVGALYNQLKAPHTKRISPRWYATPVAVIALWLVVVILPGRLWTRLVFHPWSLTVVGMVLLGVFTAFTLWARFVLGRMWSGTPLVKEGHDLKTIGPYGVTRHPIYTGLLGMILGTALEHGFGKVVPVFLVILVFFEIKIQLEERLMNDTFGEKYAAYKRSVPQLMPGAKWPLRLWGSLRR